MHIDWLYCSLIWCIWVILIWWQRAIPVYIACVSTVPLSMDVNYRRVLTSILVFSRPRCPISCWQNVYQGTCGWLNAYPMNSCCVKSDFVIRYCWPTYMWLSSNDCVIVTQQFIIIELIVLSMETYSWFYWIQGKILNWSVMLQLRISEDWWAWICMSCRLMC